MTCNACGWNQFDGARFCGRCGVPLAPGQDALMPGTRVQQNLQPLGITWMLFGAYRLLSGLLAAVVLRKMVHGGAFEEVPPFVLSMADTFLPFVGTLVAVMGVLSIVVGYGLIARRSWARSLAMVMAVLALLKLPLGTALGIYTLWVLGPRSSCAEWQGLQQS